MGIGGVGMAGLAVFLKSRGWQVDGCDVHLGPRTDWLKSQGIPIFEGHDPRHLEGADLLVITPAVHSDNPERLFACQRVPVRYRGEVLAQLVSEAPDSIAVCGSHGKTTTATWIAKLLIALGESVEWAIGGETGTFPVAGKEVKSKSEKVKSAEGSSVLVVEADESDGTLAKYRAKMLVVTNCEYDHPDHFKTREAYVACYDAARRNAAEVVEGETSGEVGVRSEEVCKAEWFSALAEHNRKNALMAMEVARRRGHRPEDILAAMPDVVKELPDRRFQILPSSSFNLQPSVTLVTDYAHHPTEIKCAVEMARKICRGKLRVMFQPHRYSRTKALLRDFPASFEGADEVVLCPTYAAFEKPLEGGSTADLYRECRGRSEELGASGSARFYLARSCEEAWTHLKRSAEDGDVLLVLGAGDMLFKLRELPTQRIWIGAGTNTWQSDLNLPVEYVKTAGRANAPGASLNIPWMAGIPGTIGGWVKMNAGAFGHSISEVLDAVQIDGEWVEAASCGFGYRTSNITGEIQDVRLKPAESLSSLMSPLSLDFLARRKKFPTGTKGSVFKNPPNDFAGRLLEAADCKGLRVGGAYVWEEHANVIVAKPSATSSDFLALAQIMHNRVLARFGVDLEYEVTGLSQKTVAFCPKKGYYSLH